MSNVRVRWVLPTVRQNGRPLDVSQIAGVEIAISGDGGANFTAIDAPFPPNVLETTVTELEPGDWLFQGVVIDSAGRRSNPVIASIAIEDTSPPGELILELTLV